MRNISFSLTTRQFLDHSKDVTRRIGWKNLKAGDRLMGCEKCMGRKHGEPLVRIGAIEVVSVRREPLNRLIDEPEYGISECRREGFPNMTPREFVTFFRESHGMKSAAAWVTRIEFKHV